MIANMKKRHGTSIIEVVVAIAIISTLLIWMVNFFRNISTGSVTAEDLLMATHLASDRIEYLKTQDKTSLSGLGQDWQDAHSPYENFEYKFTKQPPEENTQAWLIEIDVEVRRKSTTETLIKMKCNFLRDINNGTNIGL